MLLMHTHFDRLTNVSITLVITKMRPSIRKLTDNLAISAVCSLVPKRSLTIRADASFGAGLATPAVQRRPAGPAL